MWQPTIELYTLGPRHTEVQTQLLVEMLTFNLLFTDQLGQRAVIHQFSLDVLPPEFQRTVPPEFAQTTEAALSGSRRYRTALCNAD